MIGQNLKYLFIIFSLINYLGSREILSQSDQNITANIIPTPYVLKLTDGNFVINSNTEIYFNNDALVAVEYIREILEPSTEIKLRTAERVNGNQIQFVPDTSREQNNKESSIN